MLLILASSSLPSANVTYVRSCFGFVGIIFTEQSNLAIPDYSGNAVISITILFRTTKKSEMGSKFQNSYVYLVRAFSECPDKIITGINK